MELLYFVWGVMPHIIMAAAQGCCMVHTYREGRDKTPEMSKWLDVAAGVVFFSLLNGLLWWGGFWGFG